MRERMLPPGQAEWLREITSEDPDAAAAFVVNGIHGPRRGLLRIRRGMALSPIARKSMIAAGVFPVRSPRRCRACAEQIRDGEDVVAFRLSRRASEPYAFVHAVSSACVFSYAVGDALEDLASSRQREN